MPSQKQQYPSMFWELAGDLARERPDLANTVLCPLCLRQFGEAVIADLSVEHIIASKLGGRGKTLTCRRCNNTQGSRFDKHLVDAMKAIDGIEGLAPIQASWHSPMGRISGDLLLGNGDKDQPITFRVGRKARNVPAIEAVPTQLFDGAELAINMNYSVIPERYWRAALRTAYLATFSVHGYKYILSRGAAQVRAVLDGNEGVPDKAVMAAFPETDPTCDMIIMPGSLAGLGDFYVVLLRMHTKRIRYLAVLLPGQAGCDWRLLTRINAYPVPIRIQTTPPNSPSELFIGLGEDPIKRLGRPPAQMMRTST